jgi:signal transduction histidine kinase/CheY-like chemotaxis protein
VILATIRSRMLVAALLPVGVVVLTLAGFFWLTRAQDVGESHAQRGTLLLRQVAMSSEFGLFVGNMAVLQGVVSTLSHEADVRSVALFDASGALLVHAGTQEKKKYAELTEASYLKEQLKMGVETLYQPIAPSQVEIDDLYSEPPVFNKPKPLVLGYAVVQMSRDSVVKRQRELLLLSLLMGLGGLLAGGVLAVRLGEGVVRPILRVSNMIQRIGVGDLTARIAVKPEDPLHELHQGLNDMATRLAWGRTELEQRVDEVTVELSIKKQEAEAATLAKSRFLAAASHDLRQPTHALGMFIARLGQLPLDDQVRRLVGNLEASTQAMQDLLDGLLDISRLDVGAVPVKVSDFALQSLLDVVQGSLAPLAVSKGLRLRVRPSAVWVRSDAALLQRMVMNLTHNALRYTQTGSVLVACRLSREGTRVRIEVRDSGVGIAPVHQREIFKEFFQVGNAGRDRNQGLGLGLHIVERSAQLLGVQVALQSALGCGTRITLTLPTTMPQPVPAQVADAVLPADLHGARVLVIEDDVLACEAVCELLVSWGCSVVFAQNGEQVVALMMAGPDPDVVVSDYRLADGDNGLRIIGIVRAMAGYKVPACLMSGDTDPALMEEAQNVDLTLLHKPVRPAKLRSLLRHLVLPKNTGAQA